MLTKGNGRGLIGMIFAAWAVYALASLAVVVGLAYVAFHFIAKFW